MNPGQGSLKIFNHNLPGLVDLDKGKFADEKLMFLEGLEVTVAVCKEKHKQVLAQLVSQGAGLTKIANECLLLGLIKGKIKKLAGLSLGGHS